MLDDPLLATIVSTPSWTTTTWRRRNSFSSALSPMGWSESNTNQLLPGRLQAYEGAYGVKTGTSGRAGENLVSAATNTSKPAPAPATRRRGVARQRPSRGPPSRPVQPSPGTDRGCDRGGARLSDNDPATTADRFDDSKIVLDFALGRTP